MKRRMFSIVAAAMAAVTLSAQEALWSGTQVIIIATKIHQIKENTK